MATVNSYATLAEYKAFATSRGQTATSDNADDGVIEDLLTSSSRLIDQTTRRRFYPRYETRSYDIPDERRLFLHDDLLAITTLTNGDDTTLASTEYVLEDYNYSPHYAIKLRDSSSYSWESDSNSSGEKVIDVTGLWGYHDEYSQRAWSSGGTLSANISSTSALTFSMIAGHTLEIGNIVRIGNEILNITGVAINTITVLKRGDNGSTAATATSGDTVYIWNPIANIKDACLQIATNGYKRRFGETTASVAAVTAAGVMLTPDDIPANVYRALKDFRTLT